MSPIVQPHVAVTTTAPPATAPTMSLPTAPPFVIPIQQPQLAPQSIAPQLPLVLLVLDGWGVAAPSRGNAISLARTPNMDTLMQQYPTLVLHASGEVVGLPWGEVGNSEVGHLNIGSGKIIYQSLPQINRAISDGVFFENPAFTKVMDDAKASGSALHLLGMVSDGGIHSSEDHLYALLEMARDRGLNSVFVHAILDGRDSDKNGALGYIAKLETKMQETGVGKIASLSGRYWAMDRDNRWDRIEAGYNAIVHGKAAQTSDSPLKAIEQSYARQVFDEEFEPTVLLDPAGLPVTTIQSGDGVIFFNFRADRARQLTKAFVLPAFQKFDRGQAPDVHFVSMTEYEKNLPLQIAFAPDQIQSPIAKVIADRGMRQLHVAETEKYAHVTYFFNGGSEDAFPGEDRVLVPSPRVSSYAQTPAMSVAEIATKLVTAINGGQYHFIVANFANADMIGHTGDLAATIGAVESADAAIGQVAQAILGRGGTLLVTADHGNAEEMFNLQTGEVNKEHTSNPVPLIMCNTTLASQRMMWPPVIDGDLSRMQPVGVLSDVAPTVLQLMGLQPPPEMTSRSLIH